MEFRNGQIYNVYIMKIECANKIDTFKYVRGIEQTQWYLFNVLHISSSPEPAMILNVCECPTHHLIV